MGIRARSSHQTRLRQHSRTVGKLPGQYLFASVPRKTRGSCWIWLTTSSGGCLVNTWLGKNTMNFEQTKIRENGDWTHVIVAAAFTFTQDDYMGLIELTQAMNARYSNRTEVQLIAQSTLCKIEMRMNFTFVWMFWSPYSFAISSSSVSLFPSWLPGQFAILFSRPFPKVRWIADSKGRFC